MSLIADLPRLLLGATDAFPFLEMYVFLLAGFLGYQIITRVPALLHTPAGATAVAVQHG